MCQKIERGCEGVLLLFCTVGGCEWVGGWLEKKTHTIKITGLGHKKKIEKKDTERERKKNDS